jgi:hypothetical protein
MKINDSVLEELIGERWICHTIKSDRDKKNQKGCRERDTENPILKLED